MTHLPRIDMNEVTRLTRLGRLDDAMALLRGGPRTGPVSETARPADEARVIDMEADETGTFRAASAPIDSEDSSPAPADDPLAAFQSFQQRFGGKMPAGLDLSSLNRPHGTTSRVALAIPDGARWEAGSHRHGRSERRYRLYVPANRSSEAMPLIVMLHGCTQNAEDFALGTAMNEMAEARGFCVLYPEQSRQANQNGCWNWFTAEGQSATDGESALLADMVRAIAAVEDIDSKRIYAAGLSAGGAMAAILGQNHGDLFAAIGVHSGLAAGSANNIAGAFSAMKNGGPGGASSRAVRAICIHGDSDRTVGSINGVQVIEQALGGARLQKSRMKAGNHTRERWTDSEGRAQAEHWILHGSGHAWSGGSPMGSYTDPAGPSATEAMVSFFLDAG